MTANYSREVTKLSVSHRYVSTNTYIIKFLQTIHKEFDVQVTVHRDKFL